MQVAEGHSEECVVGGVKMRRSIDHILITDVSSRVAYVQCSTNTSFVSKLSHKILAIRDDDLLIAGDITALASDG
jgi:hypothetical protein